MPAISTIPDAISKVTGRMLDQAQLRRRVGGGCQPASDVTVPSHTGVLPAIETDLD
jgi:hypothetical protein